MAWTDDFNRGTAAAIGNDWVEKEAAAAELVSDVVNWTGTVTSYREAVVYRPITEAVQNVEARVEVDFSTVPGDWCQIWARLDTTAVSTPNTLTGYGVGYNATDGEWQVWRNVGTGFVARLAGIALSAAVNVTDTYRIGIIVEGTSPVDVTGYVERWTGSLWDRLGESTANDSDPILRITAAGTVGFSGFTSAYFDYDNFYYDDLTPTGPEIELTSQNLIFAAETVGGDDPPDQVVTISNGGIGTLAWTRTIRLINGPNTWLTAMPAAGGEEDLTVSCSIAGLDEGQYNDVIRIQDSNADPPYEDINVTLSVGVFGAPIISLVPTSLDFSVENAGDPNPAAKTVAISNTGGGTLAWNRTIVGGSAWLTATPAAGGEETLTVSCDVTGLIANQYSDTISINDSSADNTPQDISVSLNVGSVFEDDFTRGDSADVGNDWVEKTGTVWQILSDTLDKVGAGSDNESNIVYRPTSESILDVEISAEFRYDGTPSPDYPQIFARLQNPGATISGYCLFINNSTTSAILTRYDVGVANNLGGAITLSPAIAAATTYRLRMRVMDSDPVVISAWVERWTGSAWNAIGSVENYEDSSASRIATEGTVGISGYTATDYYFDNFSRTNLWQDVPRISFDESDIYFNAIESGANPANQTVTVGNSQGGTLAWSQTNDAAWLTVTPASGGEEDLTLAVDITGLAQGLYTGKITVTDPNASNNPAVVTVRLTIHDGTGPFHILAIGDSLTFGEADVGPTTPDGPWPFHVDELLNLTGNTNTYYNSGRSGQTSTQIVARLASDIIQENPDIVQMNCGMNDLRYGGANTLTLLLANLDTALTACTAAGIPLIMSEITPHTFDPINPPTNYDEWSESLQTDVKVWNAAIERWCIINDVDLNPTYQDMAEKLGGTQEDDILAAYDADELHFTPAGYERFGRLRAYYGIPLRRRIFGNNQHPLFGYESWDWFLLSSGATITGGEADTGTLNLPQNDTADSPVKSIEEDTNTIEITPTLLTGSVNIYYRTNTENFTRDTASGTLGWILYTVPFSTSDQFIQFRLEGINVNNTIGEVLLDWSASTKQYTTNGVGESELATIGMTFTRRYTTNGVGESELATIGGATAPASADLTFRLYTYNQFGDASSTYASLVATNPVPADVYGLTVIPVMGGAYFYWSAVGVQDFSHYEYRTQVESDGWSYWSVSNTTAVTRILTAAEKTTHGVDANIQIQVRAVDVFEQAGGSVATDVDSGALNIQPTDIEDFAVDASNLFVRIPIIENLTITDNSPLAGNIAWNAHSLFYNGVEYSIVAGSTGDYFVYWLNGQSTYQTSDTHPADLLAWNPGEDFIIAVNDGGTGQEAWNAIANQVIGSAYIMRAAVGDLQVDTLSGSKITAGTLNLVDIASDFDLNSIVGDTDDITEGNNLFVSGTERAGAGYAYTGLDENGRLTTQAQPAENAAPSGAGLYLASDYMGFYDGNAWQTYLDNSGNFALGTALTWDTQLLSVQGSLYVSETSTVGSVLQINEQGFIRTNTTGEYPHITISSEGIQLKDSSEGDTFGTGVFGTAVFGLGTAVWLLNKDKQIPWLEQKEPVNTLLQSVPSIKLFDRQNTPQIIDSNGGLAVVQGELRFYSGTQWLVVQTAAPAWQTAQVRDTLGISDTVSVNLYPPLVGASTPVADSVSMSDVAAGVMTMGFNISDSISVADVPAPDIPMSVDIGDAVSISDLPLTLNVWPLLMDVDEPVTIADAPTVAVEGNRFDVSDLLTLADSSANNLWPPLSSVSETVSIADAPVMAMSGLAVSASDSITIADTASAATDGGAAAVSFEDDGGVSFEDDGGVSFVDD